MKQKIGNYNAKQYGFFCLLSGMRYGQSKWQRNGFMHFQPNFEPTRHDSENHNRK